MTDAEQQDFRDALAIMVKRVAEALSLAARYGGIDGDHRKAWVIDQMVRKLAGANYESFVREACHGVDGPDTYTWDVGVAP